MSKATFKAINKAIEPLEMEIVKGNGYFYFVPLETAPLDKNFPEVESVYTMRLNDLSLEAWIEHVEQFFST